jgi:threonine synthase
MRALHTNHNYIADPHGAVGYLGLKEYLKEHPDAYGVFLETAHPVKFLPAVEPIVGPFTEFPEQIKGLVDKKKVASKISNYEGLKAYLT